MFKDETQLYTQACMDIEYCNDPEYIRKRMSQPDIWHALVAVQQHNKDLTRKAYADLEDISKEMHKDLNHPYWRFINQL